MKISPVPPDFAAQLRRKWHFLGGVTEILQAHSQKDILDRNLVGRNLERADAIGRRADPNLQGPGLVSLLAYTQGNAARRRPAKSQADIVEREVGLGYLVRSAALHRKSKMPRACPVEFHAHYYLPPLLYRNRCHGLVPWRFTFPR